MTQTEHIAHRTDLEPAHHLHTQALQVQPTGRLAHRHERAPEAFDNIEVLPDPIMTAARVSVVIPTLNEADNLPHVFERMPPEVAEVVLVDGKSTDGTVEVAKSLRPDIVVVNQTGKGKGNALAAGFWAATGDIIVMLDADGSTDPAEIPRYVAALLAGADFAKGSRFIAGGGSADITTIRRIGNWFRGVGRIRSWAPREYVAWRGQL